MPPKLQKSRLNSKIDIKRNSVTSDTKTAAGGGDNSKVTKPIKKKNKKKSIDEKYLQYEIEDYDEMEEENDKIEPVLSRTSLLILDYLQFKAARTIQRYVRGWLNRTLYQRKRKSVIIIQAQWRRFFCQRRYFIKVEQTLQQRIEEHFYQAARKIQALWRGWWSRQHIHDHTLLMRLQLTAGEDLLYCVAFKLHHLLRTHQIPGIYSLRNSTAFSKVEILLATLSFKSCNEHAKQHRDHHDKQIDYAKQRHKNSKYGTELPFSGPNINNICIQKCMPLFTEKDADRKMARILKLYNDAHQESERPKHVKHKSKYVKKYRDKSAPTTFCGEVVRSMKKWKIVKENNLKVENDVFDKPENVESFLKEIESKLSFMQEKCNCGQDYLKNKQDKPKQENPEEFRNSYTYSNGPAKLTTSFASQMAGSTEDCGCFADQIVFRNTMSSRTSYNLYNSDGVRISVNAENQRKSYDRAYDSINSNPTKVSGYLYSPDDPRKSGTSEKAKKSITSEVVIRNSSGKGILRNSVPIEVQRMSMSK